MSIVSNETFTEFKYKKNANKTKNMYFYYFCNLFEILVI